ncbi:MAG: mobile mystery protein A [Parasphingorhabdus sp.]|uniref:mobile mystery protein A n=1 Tax=Parasphingorhabdus sp. TaxID=2709688 RepID=UPI0030020C79
MSNAKQSALARKNLDKRLGFLRDADLTSPKTGWIRAIRDALGMSSRQLASRLGVSQSRITPLERAEAHGGATLKTLKEAAEALDCTLVYAFVPNKPLDQIVEDRARSKARGQIGTVSHAMLLENQSMTKTQMEEELERITRDILAEPISKLWDDE